MIKLTNAFIYESRLHPCGAKLQLDAKLENALVENGNAVFLEPEVVEVNPPVPPLEYKPETTPEPTPEQEPPSEPEPTPKPESIPESEPAPPPVPIGRRARS